MVYPNDTQYICVKGVLEQYIEIYVFREILYVHTYLEILILFLEHGEGGKSYNSEKKKKRIFLGIEHLSSVILTYPDRMALHT